MARALLTAVSEPPSTTIRHDSLIAADAGVPFMFRIAFFASVLIASIAGTATAVDATPLVVGAATADTAPFYSSTYFTAALCPGTDWTVELTPATSNDDPDAYVNVGTPGFPAGHLGEKGDAFTTERCGVAEISTIADSPTLREARIQVFSYGDCNGNRRDTPFSIKVFPATPGFQCAKDADHDGVPDDRDVCPWAWGAFVLCQIVTAKRALHPLLNRCNSVTTNKCFARSPWLHARLAGTRRHQWLRARPGGLRHGRGVQPRHAAHRQEAVQHAR
jgi:hypothetical protein